MNEANCWCCGKENVNGDFYVGKDPYAEEMCIGETERQELPDECLCDECYTNSVMDI